MTFSDKDMNLAEWLWLMYIIRPILLAWGWLKYGSSKGSQLAYAQSGPVPDVLATLTIQKDEPEKIGWLQVPGALFALGSEEIKGPSNSSIRCKSELPKESRKLDREKRKAKEFTIVSIAFGLLLLGVFIFWLVQKFGLSLPKG